MLTEPIALGSVGINNYFKVYRNQIFPFNDQSDLSMSLAFNIATVRARGGKIVVWKRFLGMPDFLQVVGEVPDYIPSTGRKPKPRLVDPRMPQPAEPDGGADDYLDDDDDENGEAEIAADINAANAPNGKARTNGAMG